MKTTKLLTVAGPSSAADKQVSTRYRDRKGQESLMLSSLVSCRPPGLCNSAAFLLSLYQTQEEDDGIISHCSLI